MKEILRGKMDHGGIYVHLKSPKSSQRLELNYYPRGTKFHHLFQSGSELDHLAFWVHDVEKTYRTVLAKGGRKAVPPFHEGAYTLAFVKDPDGCWIELIGKRTS